MLAKAGEADRHIRTKMVGGGSEPIDAGTGRPLNLFLCSRNIYFLARGREGRHQDDDRVILFPFTYSAFHLACVEDNILIHRPTHVDAPAGHRKCRDECVHVPTPLHATSLILLSWCIVKVPCSFHDHQESNGVYCSIT